MASAEPSLTLAADRLHPVPDALDDHTAALIEPLSTPVHAVRLAGDVTGRSVAVLGAGTIGLFTLAVGALVVLARTGAKAGASAGAGTGALTAGGPAALARVQRLLVPPAPGRPGRRAAVAAALIPPALLACLLLAVAACDVMPHR